MSSSDDIEPTDTDEASRRAEIDLDSRISLSTGLAESALKQALHFPNPTALAALDRAVDLLRFFEADARRLKDKGRPAPHARLGAILEDLTAARATLANTMKGLAAPDSDPESIAKGQADLLKQQQEWIDNRNALAQSQAKERGKLL